MPKSEDIKTLMSNMETNLKSEFRNLLKHELNTYLVKFEEKLDKIMTDLKHQKEEILEVQTSQTFINNELEEIKKKVKSLEEDKKNNSQMHEKLNEKTNYVQNKIEETGQWLDDLDQYGRRENLEFHGIPKLDKENTNIIIKDLLKLININVNDNQISTSHRLPSTKNDRSPTILVRFINRDIRNTIYFQRSKFAKIKDFGIPGMNNLFINENLTSKKKNLFIKTLRCKYEKKYKYIWTFNGDIYVRKDDSMPREKISTLADVLKMQ